MKPVEVEFIYDGEHLRNTRGDVIERYSIQSLHLVILIVQEGVEHIPRRAFNEFEQLSRLKMADTVKTIGPHAFAHCKNLHEITWSRNLESIGDYAFFCCDKLGSIGFGCTNFIPPSCRRIGVSAFTYCMGLDLCIVPHDTELDRYAFRFSRLDQRPPFQSGDWIKYHQHDDYPLHAMFAKTKINTKEIMQRLTSDEEYLNCPIGWRLYHEKDQYGLTPMDYLNANPYAEKFDEWELMRCRISRFMNFDEF